MKIRLLLLILIFASRMELPLRAQTHPDLILKNRLTDDSFTGKMQHLFVQGDEPVIRDWLAENGGKVKFVSHAGMAIRLKGEKIPELLALKAVRQVFFNNYPGALLNDHAMQNANVAGLQTAWEFDSTLTGKGVIVGFIDSGIDYSHQDFIDSNGQSRILFIWDQNNPEDTSLIFEDYGYGQLITGDTLNKWLENDVQIPLDPNNFFGHGSTVAGAACANGRALKQEVEAGMVPSDLHGVAPESKIIMVSSDFSNENWLATIADGVDFMLNKAEELGMPIVINLSVGTYLGSHDALDPVGLTINEWFSDEYTGRMLVCAAGNSGNLRYHLGYNSSVDTSLSFFKTHDALSDPGKGAFFETWIDSVNTNAFKTAVGLADLANADFPVRTSFRTIGDQLDSLFIDTLYSDTLPVAIVSQWMENRGEQIRVQTWVKSVTGNRDVVFYTLGNGRIDCWSAGWLGTSDIVGPEQLASLPPSLNEMIRLPDSAMQVVSSFSCAENVLTVANYKNRTQYIDVNGNTQQFEGQTGQRTSESSRGPTRDNRLKPDVTASGDLVLSSGAYNIVNQLLGAEPFKVALGGKHIRNGGTSMASPIVAGVAALYLQHCNESFPSEIKNSINQTALQDIFTGALPNKKWGNGKIDGLAAVNSGLFTVEIIADEPCEDGKVTLRTSNDFAAYLWSTGATTPGICAAAGEYRVTVSDMAGCWSVSEPFTLVIQGVEAYSQPDVMAYPNPNDGFFTLLNVDKKHRVRVINTLGQDVDFKIIHQLNGTGIQIMHAQPGIYFILLSGSSGSIKVLVK